jgi:hypothetical protein
LDGPLGGVLSLFVRSKQVREIAISGSPLYIGALDQQSIFSR